MQNEAMKMGCLAFLQKPIQIERIISILKQSKRHNCIDLSEK